MTKQPKPWFRKELAEITKYDWRDAVNAAPKWKRETILGRVATKIADFYNAELGYAFPSLNRLAAELNLTPEKVSLAISKMKREGALEKVHRREVSPEVAPKKGERGLFLKLNFGWAADMAELVSKPQFAKGEEGAALRDGRLRRQSRKLPVTDKNNLPVTDNQVPYDRREVDTLEGHPRDTDIRYEQENLGVYRREGERVNSYASAKDDDRHIPFPIPSSEEEFAEMMSMLFTGAELGPLALQRMRTLLATGRLTPAIVQGQQRRTDAA